MSCLTSQELSRAVSAGDAPPHLAGCPRCTREWEATRAMIELARDASPPLPPPAHREAVRTMLLAASRTADVLQPERRSRARVVYAAAAGVLAAAAIAIVVFARGPSTPAAHVHATLRPHAGADFTATQPAPDELVYLRDGVLDVDVAPLHPGERFRIVLADAEIEVHGTRFVATAAGGKLVAVDVAHGIVEVRARGASSVLLRVGESWRPPAPVPVITATPTPPPPAPPPPAKPKAKAKRVAAKAPVVEAPVAAPAVEPLRERAPRLPQERAYDEGWAAMRAGKFTDAAKDFARVQLLDPGGALAEDATYWYAVALARGNDNASAITAFGDFLDHYAKSRRAGEASAMLGWLLVGAQRPAEAERRFRAAVNDPTPAVRDSARAGLDAVRASR